MFYEINILVIFKFLCYLHIMNIIHWCLQYGVCVDILEMFVCSSWFVHELSTCVFIDFSLDFLGHFPETFLPCPCLTVLFLSLSSLIFRVLYILYLVGGVQGTCDQHAVYACLCFCLRTAVDHFQQNLI
jgi:hypothetical protein